MKQISDEDYKKLKNLIYQIRHPELEYNSPRDIIRSQICKGEKAHKIMCIAWSNIKDFDTVQGEPVIYTHIIDTRKYIEHLLNNKENFNSRILGEWANNG